MLPDLPMSERLLNVQIRISIADDKLDTHTHTNQVKYRKNCTQMNCVHIKNGDAKFHNATYQNANQDDDCHFWYQVRWSESTKEKNKQINNITGTSKERHRKKTVHIQRKDHEKLIETICCQCQCIPNEWKESMKNTWSSWFQSAHIYCGLVSQITIKSLTAFGDLS